MVLSTLHTNDAPQTVVRLMNMGVPGYNIASTLSLIIAQRLARKLCPQCKRETSIPRPELLRQGFTEAEIDTPDRSEEHTSELQSLLRISYAVFCLKKKITHERTQD